MTFSSQSGVVLLQDGPYAPRPLDQRACDQLSAIFYEARAIHHFNQLHECMKAAGYILWGDMQEAA